MSKVNSQSQSGTSSHSSPLLSGGLLGANTAGQEPQYEGVLQRTDSEALTKRAKVKVNADKNSNAQGQSQITQADWNDVVQVIVPVGVQVDGDN